MKYKCDICIYDTDQISQFNMHNSSKKHIKKIKDAKKTETPIPHEQEKHTTNDIQKKCDKETENKIQCDLCSKFYNSKKSLSNHRQMCGMKCDFLQLENDLSS